MLSRLKTMFNILTAALLVLVFIATAAALLLGTAGYTYNLKKREFEKTGILVIKTVPSDARVFLGNRLFEKHTPVRIRRLPPADYEVRIERDGYLPWSGRLPVASARVTFAEDIRLFPRNEPELVAPGEIRASALSADGRSLAWVTEASSTLDLYLLNIKQTAPERLASLPHLHAASDIHLSWSPETSHLLLTVRPARPNDSPIGATVFLLPPHGPVVKLDDILGEPPRSVSWAPEGGLIEALVGAARLEIDPVGRRVVHTEKMTAGQETAVRGPARAGWIPAITPTRGLLALSYLDRPAADLALRTVAYRWAPDGSDLRLLVWNESELWLLSPHASGDEPGADPLLLLRRGAGIEDASWEGGSNILFASNGDLTALGVSDYGSGRETVRLAHFDSITGLHSLRDGSAVFIAGVHSGHAGLYRLPLE